MNATATIDLQATAELVWERVVAWELQPLWMRDAADVRVLTSHRAGPGVRVAVRTRVAGVPAFTDPLEVTVWDPPRRLVLAHRGFVRGVGEWTLESVGDRTRFGAVELIVRDMRGDAITQVGVELDPAPKHPWRSWLRILYWRLG